MLERIFLVVGLPIEFETFGITYCAKTKLFTKCD